MILGSDWPDHYPDLILGMSWSQKNNATIDTCNLLLTIDDNFAIPFKGVKYEPTQNNEPDQ